MGTLAVIDGFMKTGSSATTIPYVTNIREGVESVITPFIPGGGYAQNIVSGIATAVILGGASKYLNQKNITGRAFGLRA